MKFLRIGDESFIEDLSSEEKKWLTHAIIGMINVDRVIKDSEMRVLHEILGFMESTEIEGVAEMIRTKSVPNLEALTTINRNIAAQMLFYIGTTSIIDDKISKSEVEYFKYVGKRLGFDSRFCLEIVQVLYKILEAKKEYDKMMTLASKMQPFFDYTENQ